MDLIATDIDVRKYEREGVGPRIQKMQLMHGERLAVDCAPSGCKHCLQDICDGCWKEKRVCECEEVSRETSGNNQD